MALIKLEVSKDVARTRIRKQIEEGEEILARVVGDRAAAERFLAERKEWSAFTSNVLRHSFTETEYDEDFVAEWDAATMYGTGETLGAEVEIGTTATKAQLGVLRIIERNIEILQEPAQVSTENATGATQIPIGSGPRIFISHSSVDAKAAEALANLFQAALSIPASNIRCTSVLAYSLPYGVNSTETLRHEVSAAAVVVGLVTPSSTESHWVLFELGARWGQHKLLFSVLARGADYRMLPDPIRGNHALKVDSAGPWGTNTC
jgi:hypothetical protein